MKQTRKSIRPYKPRSSLKPGAVLILLIGRFKGKRAVLLSNLPEGKLLITGPFKVNGIPIRRIDARFVIATSTVVPLTGIDESIVKKISEPSYWARDRKADKKATEEAYFNLAETPKKKEPSKSRAEDQKAVDKALLATIKKEPMLAGYLNSRFKLQSGDKPHEMVF